MPTTRQFVLYRWLILCINPKNTLIACPSAWSIRVSFFYVPKKYPNRIREKKQSPWTIQILSQIFFLNLAMFKIFSMSQKVSGEKKQTPWTIQIVSDTSGTQPNFLGFFMKIKNFITCVFFVKIWQCLTLCSSQSKRQIIAKCKIRWLCSDIILCSWKKYKHLELSD